MKGRGGKSEEQHLHTAVFALIVGLLMACHVSLVEQWRARIFLVLNLIFLAVLFTSLRSDKAAANNADTEEVDVVRDQKIVAKRCRRRSLVTDSSVGGDQSEIVKKVNEVSCYNKEGEAVDDEELLLSEEELNRRVEDFIAMFRRHLVLDSRKRSSSKIAVAATTTD